MRVVLCDDRLAEHHRARRHERRDQGVFVQRVLNVVEVEAAVPVVVVVAVATVVRHERTTEP